jgi:hypothetical protein
MLDRQLDAYPAYAAFRDSALGLLSFAREAVALLAIEAEHSSPAPDPRVLECALGIVSLARTLNGVLSTADPAAEPSGKMPVPRESDDLQRWLR